MDFSWILEAVTWNSLMFAKKIYNFPKHMSIRFDHRRDRLINLVLIGLIFARPRAHKLHYNELQDKQLVLHHMLIRHESDSLLW